GDWSLTRSPPFGRRHRRSVVALSMSRAVSVEGVVHGNASVDFPGTERSIGVRILLQYHPRLTWARAASRPGGCRPRIQLAREIALAPDADAGEAAHPVYCAGRYLHLKRPE